MLELQHVSGGYLNKEVLHDVSFQVPTASITALIGLNGAGKSTTIKHILGLLPLRQGQIINHGLSLNAPNYLKQLAYVPEMPMLYQELTVQEHVELVLTSYHVDDKERIKKRALNYLKAFRLEHEWTSYPAYFSKGMQQKVMLVCALMLDVPLYVIDEPFLGLDPLGIQTLLEIITIKKQEGRAVLLSTHVLDTAERFCDHFIIIDAGQVINTGTLDELLATTHTHNLSDAYFHLVGQSQRVATDLLREV
ncbi:ABC transporter ATP-binding protein [Atopobacter phocae]|uniref:ABC transporter ATP-binding protein n=1 Tax=Atopobacter phocae TaxID=136492 RepID=UPI000472416E|nr:ABC transporter ATP-binding protein [Atopobacter phocae]